MSRKKRGRKRCQYSAELKEEAVQALTDKSRWLRESSSASFSDSRPGSHASKPQRECVPRRLPPGPQPAISGVR
jgi:hypothetical protein